MSFRSILVPLDGSQFGEYALPHASSLARRAGAGLTLARVRVPPSHLSSADIHLPVPPDEEQRETEQARAYLSDVANRVRAAFPAVEVTTTLLDGGVGDALCGYMNQAHPDLVVLTTHGRGPLSRFWLGSVATDLVRRAPAPVLLVRPQEGPPDLAADAAPRRILIPLDGSPFGQQILPTAVAVGTLMGAEYRLLRVVPPVLSSTGGGLGELGGGSRTVADQLRAEASGYLVGLATRVPALSAAAIHVAVDWPPAVAILADAEASGIDLIALETRGRSGLARLLLGSVADKVVRGSTVPVLLRRPDGG
jgi:nucleotide-binding universal stress UspA family protein